MPKTKLKGKEAFYFYIIDIIANGEECLYLTYIALISKIKFGRRKMTIYKQTKRRYEWVKLICLKSWWKVNKNWKL